MATLSYPGKLLKTWLQDLRLPGAPRSTMRWRPTYHSLHCRKIHQTASCQPASPLTNRSELKPERFIKSIAGFQWFNWVQICSGQGIQGIHGLEISRATVGGGRSFCAHFEARPQMKAAARVASSIIVHQYTSAPALTGGFFLRGRFQILPPFRMQQGILPNRRFLIADPQCIFNVSPYEKRVALPKTGQLTHFVTMISAQPSATFLHAENRLRTGASRFVVRVWSVQVCFHVPDPPLPHILCRWREKRL